jgi:nitrogen fixation NifU-like protein
MTVLPIVMAFVVLTAMALVWIGIHLFLHPRMDNPDAEAAVTGPCGDTMEIALKFNGPRVKEVCCWTNGCSISKMCVEMTAELARGKTITELKQIDAAAIMEKTGKLPETHLHCARLAEMTLQKAVENYPLRPPRPRNNGTPSRGFSPGRSQT